MKLNLVFAVLLALTCFAGAAQAGTAAAPDCSELRARIQTQPPADLELLRDISLRQECGFSFAEVYRAAYGDRPIPAARVEERRRYRHRHHDDD